MAVLESLGTNGKPIKESRDAASPLAASRSSLLSRSGRQARNTRIRPVPAAVGSGGASYPWKLPALDGAWKIRPALANRQHRECEAGKRRRRSHCIDAWPRSCRGRPAAGRGWNILAGGHVIGQWRGEHPASTRSRSTVRRGRTLIQQAAPGQQANGSRSKIGGSGEIRIEDEDDTTGGRRNVNGIFFQPGQCVLDGSRCWCKESSPMSCRGVVPATSRTCG